MKLLNLSIICILLLGLLVGLGCLFWLIINPVSEYAILGTLLLTFIVYAGVLILIYSLLKAKMIEETKPIETIKNKPKKGKK